jgi:hypothetical protein
MYIPSLKSAAQLALASLLLGFVTSCETDDVDGLPPGNNGVSATLSLDKTSISEDAGAATLTITLSASSASAVDINLGFGGTAVGDGTDYFASASTVSIPAGSLSGSLTLTAVQDTLEEGNEQVEISIISINGGGVNLPSVNLVIEDDDVPLQVQLILNEILYDPSNDGLLGDANGDGVYAQEEDEFLEFVNLSSQPVDLTGYQIFDTDGLTANTPRHVFPDSSIVPAGGAIVVFGGGNPTGTFGGAVVQPSSTGNMNLNNTGDVMTLKNVAGEVVLSFDIEPLSNNPNESYTRNPDITGDFEQHGDNTTILFSPGTRIDGSPF